MCNSYILKLEETAWGVSRNGDQEWSYVELGDRRGSWKKFRRPAYEDRQRLLEFARPDQILYTNLGCGSAVDEQLGQAGLERWLQAEAILEGYHGRGADELVHRALKDFASQTLPFKRFAANAAYYYTLLVAFFLYECFKEDVCQPVVPLNCYPTTLRRRIVDVVGKIVRHAGQILLKVTAATWKQLQIEPALAKERPPAAFRLGLNRKKPKPPCSLPVPVCPISPRLRVSPLFGRENRHPPPF